MKNARSASQLLRQSEMLHIAGITSASHCPFFALQVNCES
jgi:hypothetical protein